MSSPDSATQSPRPNAAPAARPGDARVAAGPSDGVMLTPQRFWRRVFAWGGLLVVLMAVIGYALFPDVSRIRARQSGEAEPGAAADAAGRRLDGRTRVKGLPVLFGAPLFELTERDGRTVRSGDLTGRVWIADFIFTNCAGPCPLMTQKMHELQQEFRDRSNLLLVSFSVDPLRDTPAVLTEYAATFKADPQRWWFLTCGDPAVIRGLATEGFRLLARETTQAERTTQGMDDLLHSTYFVLVDAAGRVRGFYDATDEARLDALRTDVRRLLAAGGR